MEESRSQWMFFHGFECAYEGEYPRIENDTTWLGWAYGHKEKERFLDECKKWRWFRKFLKRTAES
jgi:hypothetical protein